MTIMTDARQQEQEEKLAKAAKQLEEHAHELAEAAINLCWIVERFLNHPRKYEKNIRPALRSMRRKLKLAGVTV